MKAIEYPFLAAAVRDLKVGDKVSVSGRVFTGRDRLHKFLSEGGRCPVDLKDAAIYHCGPVVLRTDGQWVVRAAGPTTSMREEPYMAGIIERFQVRVIIGKGGMGELTRKACLKHGCIYLQAVGGAASLLAGRVEKVAGVHFLREFGAPEALWDLVVRDFTCVVTMDSRGRSFHKRLETQSRRALREIIGSAPRRS